MMILHRSKTPTSTVVQVGNIGPSSRFAVEWYARQTSGLRVSDYFDASIIITDSGDGIQLDATVTFWTD